MMQKKNGEQTIINSRKLTKDALIKKHNPHPRSIHLSRSCLSSSSFIFSLFINLHYKNTSTLLLHLQNNLLRLLHSYSLSLSDTSTTYPCCIPLSLHTHTHTHTHKQRHLLKICRAEDHHVHHDSQEAQESLTIRFPILLLSSNISSLSSAAAVLTRYIQFKNPLCKSIFLKNTDKQMFHVCMDICLR